MIQRGRNRLRVCRNRRQARSVIDRVAFTIRSTVYTSHTTSPGPLRRRSRRRQYDLFEARPADSVCRPSC